jgi:anthranilate synthase / indole-3-glycerol phosphate synthase / phosphoribosylanthranilate isomerase
MSSTATTAATSNPRDRTPYTPQQLKDALDSLLLLVDTADASTPDADADANADRDNEGALDDEAAHIFGHGDPGHRLSMLQVITATRILDCKQQAETTKQSSSLSSANGNSPSSFSTTRETSDMLNLQDVIRSQSPRMALAAEFKRASPSKGQIATTDATNNAGEQARRYATSGACIVSVLTEPRWFQGSLQDLEQVRAATSSLPSRDGLSSSSSQRPAILRKDFCISEGMIDEAVQSGADTVLLIVAVLPRRLLQLLIKHCRKVGMEPLVEVHTDSELRVAVHCGARVIGVNNRNLHTFHLDMNTSTRIARALDDIVKQQPPLSRKDFTLCALSGMSTADDVDLYRQSGIEMCLIGESLMRSPSPSQLIADLCLDPADYQKRKNKNQPATENGAANAAATSISPSSAPPYVDGLKLVKVCGITTAHDAVAACQAGASLIGIIFAERSPRKVATNQQAIEIVRAVRQFGEREKRLDFGTFDDATGPLDALTAKTHALASMTRRTPGVVGVFQNQDLQWIRSVADECGLDLVQLHGQEGMRAANASNFGGVPALRVVDIPVDDTVPPSNGNGSSNIADEANPTGVETKLLQSITSDPIAILLDTSIKGRGAGGGTGKSFDWSVAARLQHAGLPVIVAGGLSPDTVSECCTKIRPLGVDVSSGVESSPGVKDHEKVTRFVHAARQAVQR